MIPKESSGFEMLLLCAVFGSVIAGALVVVLMAVLMVQSFIG